MRPKGPPGVARGAYRESDSFAMWAVHHGVTLSMTTVSISADPFIPRSIHFWPLGRVVIIVA